MCMSPSPTQAALTCSAARVHRRTASATLTGETKGKEGRDTCHGKGTVADPGGEPALPNTHIPTSLLPPRHVLSVGPRALHVAHPQEVLRQGHQVLQRRSHGRRLGKEPAQVSHGSALPPCLLLAEILQDGSQPGRRLWGLIRGGAQVSDTLLALLPYLPAQPMPPDATSSPQPFPTDRTLWSVCGADGTPKIIPAGAPRSASPHEQRQYEACEQPCLPPSYQVLAFPCCMRPPGSAVLHIPREDSLERVAPRTIPIVRHVEHLPRVEGHEVGREETHRCSPGEVSSLRGSERHHPLYDRPCRCLPRLRVPPQGHFNGTTRCGL